MTSKTLRTNRDSSKHEGRMSNEGRKPKPKAVFYSTFEFPSTFVIRHSCLPCSRLPIRRQHRNERLLRDLHLADLLHLRLALLLLLEELLLPRHVAAVAFGRHVLAV